MHFDANKTIGALGILVAAKWYRATHPQHLLISLDSAEARQWMNLEQDAKRADLLGLSVEDGRPYLDIVEVKSGEDARSVYGITSEGTIEGKPVRQLSNTGRSVGGVFGLNELKEHILTPPRREILRKHLYRQGFSRPETPEEKKQWSEILNSLFSGETQPVIRLHLVVVNLGINQEPMDDVFDAEGEEIHLLHLNEHAVSLELGGGGAAVGDVEPKRQAKVRKPRATKKKASRKKATQDRKPAAEEPKAEEEHRLALKCDSDLAHQVEATCGRLRAACEDFGIKVTQIDPNLVDVGPSVLRYKIKLAAGEQGEKLRRQAENIARTLAASSVPIVEFLRGTEYMYLDLERPGREVVQLEPVLRELCKREPNRLPIAAGVDPAGKRHELDLADDRHPHLLVAGSTGSGKTIFLYSVVLSLVALHSKGTLELLIIDPKQTDFTVFSYLPQLRQDVIIDATEGVAALREVVSEEIASRSEALRKARSRDIKMYNSARKTGFMRPLVIVIDEYADLVAVLKKKEREQFEVDINRLAQRGRNVGLHLVLATQRPTADIVTGNIKANMPCRVSFSLPSSRDSQVILDQGGAERLLRNGDMLLMTEGALTRLQGYFVEPSSIEGVLREFGSRR